MTKKLKIRYKKGIIKLNPNNIFNVKSWAEAEELFFVSLDGVRREKDNYLRCCHLRTIMQIHLGKFITLECFIDILAYVGLDYETFEKFIENYKNKFQVIENETKWFYDLDKEYI